MTDTLPSQIGIPVEGLAAWKGAEIVKDKSWTHFLTAAEIAELDRAIHAAKRSGKQLTSLTREDFDLPLLAPAIARWMEALNHGRGFVLVKGFPVDRYSKEDCAAAYWALGTHMGAAVPQNRQGDLLGHVRDTGEIATNPNVRLYRTTKRQDFHTDGSDIVGLFCLRRARSGGLSQIVSSISIYNEFIRRRPDLVLELFKPIFWDRAGEQAAGELPYFQRPICTINNGHPRMFYIGWYIRDAQKHHGAEPFTSKQLDMLDLIEELANDTEFRLDMDFEPGDMQFLKNLAILHCRTEYEDFEEPDLKRHLLRLWITAQDFEDGDEELRKGIKPGATS